MTARWRLGLLAVAMVCALPAVPARCASWYGTWRLDRSRSRLLSETLRIGRTAQGYHFDFGAVSFDIGEDGRFYPTVPGRSTSLRRTGPRSWVRMHRIHGRNVDRSLLRLSPDQRTLRIDTVATSETGTVTRSREIERRVGPGHGLAGTWRSGEPGGDVPRTLVLRAQAGGRMLISAPEQGNAFVVLPNGPPAANQGPRAVAGVQLRVRMVSATEMRWTETIAHHAYLEGTDRLAPDGTLTETTWPDQFPAEKEQAVYTRRE